MTGNELDESPIDQSLAIIIATYNEIDNLPTLVEQLTSLLPEAEILVIDDNSPDGTGNWCDENKSRYPSLHCIHRSGKLGLGSATVEGFGWAIDQRHSFVATMDADFSHNPATLPDLFRKISQDTDEKLAVAIGSRYAPGGAIEGWPWFRRFASKAVNRFARLWLGLSTRDNSGAFRVYRTSALQAIGLESIHSKSYSYLEEILFRLNRAGFRFTEHPIVFKDREHGVTKTNWKLGVKVFWELFLFRFT
jgi:dolichol-phosphate mannosyltransferase